MPKSPLFKMEAVYIGEKWHCSWPLSTTTHWSRAVPPQRLAAPLWLVGESCMSQTQPPPDVPAGSKVRNMQWPEALSDPALYTHFLFHCLPPSLLPSLPNLLPTRICLSFSLTSLRYPLCIFSPSTTPPSVYISPFLSLPS